ncbi:MAG: hypothetical protein JXR68_14120 [Bacteroidales bacterium]|nr:hypothetical protein [Bacteroidales bacterium]
MMIKKIVLVIIVFSLFSMCKSTENTTYKPDFSPGPPAIVYKTKKDYSQNVPVLLSEDKSKVVGYFGPKDLIRSGELATPSTLEKGYLLDNIGINQNVAYTSLNLENYTKSMQVFTADKLFELIIDNDPLINMYNCGNRGKMINPEEQINEIILNNKLKDCKKLK